LGCKGKAFGGTKMKTTLHIFTDGGYNKILDSSYYGFVIYKDDGKIIDIMNIKTQKKRGYTDFEMLALEMAFQYISNTVMCKKHHIVIHTEILQRINSEKSNTRERFESLVGSKKIKFEYSPAHAYDLFNSLIDTMISDTNIRDLFTAFQSNATTNKIEKTYLSGVSKKGIVNIFLVVFKAKLEDTLSSGGVKLENFTVARKVYRTNFVDKTIKYRGMKLLFI
jgi:hypothetical protein